MFRNRTRITSRVWKVIFLLLFNLALAQAANTTHGQISSLDESPKSLPLNRTILRKIVKEDNRTRTTLLSNHKNELDFTNWTNFQEQIERTSTQASVKQKDLKKSSEEENRGADEKEVIPTIATIDLSNGTTLADSLLKSKPSANNGNKSTKLIPDNEGLVKLPRSKGKPIFLDALEEDSKHDHKKLDTVTSPESKNTDNHEIKKHEPEPTTLPTTNSKGSVKDIEDFDVESFKNDENEEKNEGKEETYEESAHEEILSLVNDTNVNFNHVNKTPATNNDTNVISNIDDPIEVEFDPKHDVEVVKNVTHSPIQRITQASQERVQEAFDLDKNAADQENKFVEQVSDKNATKEHESNSDSDNDLDLKDDEKVISSPELDKISPKLGNFSSNSDVPSRQIDEKKVSNTSWIDVPPPRKEILERKKTTESSLIPEIRNLNDSVSPAPRARTISFSGVNEFIPDITESKITVSRTNNTHATSITKRPAQIDEDIEQKPYPYLKTDIKKATDESDKANKATGEKINESTEEILAYENTIGRRQSDEKLVITEPSVVIENSIQQFKPIYYKRAGNATRTNSTVSDFELDNTTSRNIEQRNTTSTIEKFIPSNSTIEIPFSNEKITLSKEEFKQNATQKEHQVDFTGNGITEINSKNVSNDDVEKVISSSTEIKVTERIIEKHSEEDFTEKPKDIETKKFMETSKSEGTSKSTENPKMNVKSSEEDSDFSFSHMNATENSKEHPMKIKIERNKNQRVTINSSSESTSTPLIEETTEKPLLTTALDSNNFNNSKRVQLTSTSSVITEQPEFTTTVEYEFVGLEETTLPGEEEDTERSSTTMLPIVYDETTESIIESNTFNPRMMDQSESTTISETEAGEFPDEDKSIQEEPPEEKLTTEEQSTTLGAETMEPDETPSFSTSTVSIDQDDTTSGVSEITENDDGTTSIDDFVITTESDSFKRNTSNETGETNSSVFRGTTSKEVPIQMTTVTEHPSTMDTTEMCPTTSPTNNNIVSVTTESPTSKRTTEIPTEIYSSLPTEEIKMLAEIIFEGTWKDVCPRLQYLRELLSNLLTSGTEKSVSPRQVIFHQTQCSEERTSMKSSLENLTSLLIYVVDESGSFDETMTKMLPSLYNVSTISLPLPVHSFLLVEEEEDSGNTIAVVIVSSVAFVCLVLLAAFLFIMRKRQTRFNYGERCRPVSLDAYSLDSVSAYNSVRRKGAIRASKRSYGNPTFEDSSAIPSHPLNFAGLSTFCNDTNTIAEEFTGIPQISAKIDELPPGAEVKNRYANVIPLPETRVPLQRLNNDPLTEYINASYVRGPKNATKYYIACQAPTESTVTDFWRMIWEQQSKVIIMLTDLVENGVEKCSEYIPPSEVTDCHRLYGDYQVTLKKRETKEKYAISTLHLKNLENNTFREVSHIWYLWPTNGMSDSASLIAVLLEARALQRGGPGPIVVHCSSGTGRTGTLIALDLGIRQYEITRTVDVPRVVYTIRRDRAGAVQTKEQYAFIYKALNLYATKLSGGALESA